jgi:regulator of cell morphogenesis and NO signaling
MYTQSNTEPTIGEIVANDFRAASIFKEAGIDFCCGGNKSLSEACTEKGAVASSLLEQLETLAQTPVSGAMNFKEWNLSFLSDYIVNTHHKFVLKNLPELVFYTQKIANVHGDHHPELIEVASLFTKINDELLQHLKNEEEVLFPAIKEAEKNASPSIKSTIVSEITRMQGEHEFAGGAMDKINVLTNNYTIPDDACNTYRVSLKLLEQFEDDLHIHVHLENNILYPKALKLAE